MDDTVYRRDAIDVARKCRVIKVTPAHMLIDKAEVMAELMMLPSAQPERKKGRWVDIDAETYTWKIRCDQCGHERSMLSTGQMYPRFCENCGADMRGDDHAD